MPQKREEKKIIANAFISCPATASDPSYVRPHHSHSEPRWIYETMQVLEIPPFLAGEEEYACHHIALMKQKAAEVIFVYLSAASSNGVSMGKYPYLLFFEAFAGVFSDVGP
ncbi:hypothetical protein CEXT_419941 [Caerostris extrusa]|uniref:Uncharacterized protein n=1 Tax=Caerostris extrusa TaxID=172846 RepID=A0AAV4XDW8_CAEEX|nr:hypothetical protein CEXT_419941 [Caerostris extrusa]